MAMLLIAGKFTPAQKFLNDFVIFARNNKEAVVVSVGVVILSSILLRKSWKKQPNPFLHDSIRPLGALETDQKARDKVLKQRFLHKRVPNDLDAIVIGSGIGGLSTAVILAKAGKKVLVLEQHDRAGGCCHTFIENGYEFDIGIHYLGELGDKDSLRFLVDQLTEGQLQFAKLNDNFDDVVIGNDQSSLRQYSIYADSNRFKEALIEKFPEEVVAIDTFIDLVKDIGKVKSPYIYKFVPHWLIHVLNKLGLRTRLLGGDAFFEYSAITVEKAVAALTDNADLRAVFSYAFGDYGVLPNVASWRFHLALMKHFSSGTYYPIGGASQIPFTMIPIIERVGGKVLVNAPVTEILMEGNRAIGVRVGKKDKECNIYAPIVISAAGATNTYLRFLPREIANKGKGVLGAISSLSDDKFACFSLFVGLAGSREELDLSSTHKWCFSSANACQDVVRLMSMQADEARHCPAPLVFISFPSTKDPTWESRFPGKTTCVAIGFCKLDWFSSWSGHKSSQRGVDYKDLKKDFADRLWERVVMLYPQLEDKVRYMELGTSLTNNHYLGVEDGEIYGLTHTVDRFSEDVFPVIRAKTHVDGLYLSGQDICSCGFAGALMGGFMSATSILGRDLVGDLKQLGKLKKAETSSKSNVEDVVPSYICCGPSYLEDDSGGLCVKSNVNKCGCGDESKLGDGDKYAMGPFENRCSEESPFDSVMMSAYKGESEFVEKKTDICEAKADINENSANKLEDRPGTEAEISENIEEELECKAEVSDINEGELECKAEVSENIEEKLECKAEVSENIEEELECKADVSENNEEELECKAEVSENIEEELECKAEVSDNNEGELECKADVSETNEGRLEYKADVSENNEREFACKSESSENNKGQFDNDHKLESKKEVNESNAMYG